MESEVGRIGDECEDCGIGRRGRGVGERGIEGLLAEAVSGRILPFCASIMNAVEDGVAGRRRRVGAG